MPLVVAAVVLGVVRVPYYVIGPGPTENVMPLIRVAGHPTFPPKGKLLLVTVDLGPATAYQALAAWLSPDEQVVPSSEILSPGQTPQQQVQQSFSQMDQSKIDATMVALGATVGYPRRHGPGALVESTYPGTPAGDALAPGDVVTAIDGTAIGSADQALGIIERAAGGPALRFTVRRGRRVVTLRITPQAGALVEGTYAGLPASRVLRAGDVITAVDGRAVETLTYLADAIRRAGYGGTVRLTVLRGSRTLHVSVRTARDPSVPYPVIGVALADRFGANLVPNFPFTVSISSGDIGGPSAGLMWTLGLIDLLSSGDLAHGRTIAGTGEIQLDGTILPIGGVREKVVAAERAGASVFFVPVANANEAKSVAHGITIVPVRTYADALHYLETHR